VTTGGDPAALYRDATRVFGLYLLAIVVVCLVLVMSAIGADRNQVGVVVVTVTVLISLGGGTSAALFVAARYRLRNPSHGQVPLPRDDTGKP
jgi:hypothetical protein